ncbi:ras-associating and dilute domain-containing protein isoform X2 [Ascaphus truei]|uniref:ras-associating and dilute domain-containing protein isoform X2 n=1 Tax=Ascaphus truei TaxID=8439 RepID=UPI003F5A7A86
MMFYGSPAANMPPPSKSKLKRQSRIFSQALYRTLSYRDRRSVSALSGLGRDDPAELSTQVSAPGVLKVFGGNIWPGTHYKSVLATASSSTQELVKEALERYAVSKVQADQYVLCDVVGKLVGSHKQWAPECLRVLGDSEKPLVIQDLWKPKEGYSRRLELRKRSEVEELAAKEVDTLTAGINAQARRLQRNRAKGAALPGCQRASTPPPLRRTLSETSLSLPGAQREEPRRPYSTYSETRGEAGVLPEERSTIVRHSLYHSPHLVLLQGYSQEQDSLVYLLNREQHTVGHRTPSSKPSIILSAPDILPLHCTMRKIKPPRQAGHRAEGKLVVEPIPGACVSVNFSPVDRATLLHHGDLLSLGLYYLLLYKDPAKAQPLPGPALVRLQSLRCASHSDATCRMCGSLLRDKAAPSKKRGASTSSLGKGSKRTTKKQLYVEYERQQEDALVNRILTLIEPGSDDHKLTPSFLLCLCIQHSAFSFPPGDFGQLLLKVAQNIQRTVWEKTKELAEKQAPQQDPASLSRLTFSDLVPDLQHVLFWMSNCTELLYFIQQNSPTYLQCMEDAMDIRGSKESLFSTTITASEEAMTILEEVIMYTFQQCVYYISKCLYMVLPALLEGSSAPGDSPRLSATLPEDVRQVVLIYQETLQLLRQYEVHPDVAAQMFSYLFFFSNTLLFNQIMDKGTKLGFFRWSRGVKVRGSLRLLLAWCQDVGFGAIAEQFFSKLRTVAELLATPRSQLTQMSWGSLRAEFPSLSHSQLLCVMTHYVMPPDACSAPRWTFVDGENSVPSEGVMESFDNHPPIILPSQGFQVELDGDSVDENIYRHLLYVRHFLWGLRRTPTGPDLLERGTLQRDVSACHTLPGQNGEAPGVAAHSGGAVHTSDVRQSGNRADSEADGRDAIPTLTNGSARESALSEERLKEKLRQLHLHSTLGKATTPKASMQPLDSSCLLTPPNTPLISESGYQGSLQTNGSYRVAPDIRREEFLLPGDCPTPTVSSLSSEEDFCYVFVVEMEKGPLGLGMGLIDGLHTPLSAPGIYIRTLIPESPAATDGRLTIGDRILALNGASLIGADYRSAVELIRSGGNRLRFLVAKTDGEVAQKISTGSSC